MKAYERIDDRMGQATLTVAGSIEACDMSSEPRPNAQPEEFTNEEFRQCMEWSRHYDELIWLVTSLLIGLNAALFCWLRGVAASKGRHR